MIEVKKFVFTVSLCAMLAVNPVLAFAADEYDYSEEWVQTSHPEAVIDMNKLPTVGIASVSYVNRVVETAGNAAAHAEEHAAEAGKYAISAKDSADDAQKAADEAKGALSGKVDVEQGLDDKNKAMVTDKDGTVYPGYIATDMIADGAVTPDKISGRAVTIDKIEGSSSGMGVLMTDGSGSVKWGTVTPNMIDASSSGAGVLWTDGGSGVTWGKVTPELIHTYGDVTGLLGLVNGTAAWRLAKSEDLANGAVTSSEIANGAVTSSKIADGTIKNADIADEAAIAMSKINGLGTELGLKEDKANKVTTLSSTSTNTQYPGAKLVYDELAKKQAESTANYQMGNAQGGWTTMTADQQSALNSKITADKVSTYDGYATSKQDTITDLETIRSGAKLGATAVQPDALGALAALDTVSSTQIADGAVTAAKISQGETGWLKPGMISNGAVTTEKIKGLEDGTSGVMVTDGYGHATWSKVKPDMISGNATGVLVTDRSGNAYWSKVTQDMITSSETGASGVLVLGRNGGVSWGTVPSGMIAPRAVGISETNGVVGAVPIGKDSTSTYGKFWID